MTIRLNCDIMNTEALLVAILRETHAGNRVMFICEPGLGKRRMQAARVMLSRTRTNHKRSHRKPRQFTLHHTIHPHTEGGKRHDCVVVWQTKSQRHQIIERLDDMIGTGGQL